VNRIFLKLAIIMALLVPSSALAADWVAVKLRGHVLQLIDSQWEPVARGDVISDDRVIRTLKDGRVELQRDNETIALAPDTQIQIRDKAGKKFTTVTQHFGAVSIEADVREVQHFAVETPYLAAVVKGTRFTVTSDDKGASVKVARGLVDVVALATGAHADIPAGQTIKVSASAAIVITGRGAKSTLVMAADGEVLTAAEAATGLPSEAGPKAAAATVQTGADKSIDVSTPSGNDVSVDVGDDGVEVDVSTPAGDISIDAGPGGATVDLGIGKGGKGGKK
jgi:hypothetical protein